MGLLGIALLLNSCSSVQNVGRHKSLDSGVFSKNQRTALGPYNWCA